MRPAPPTAREELINRLLDEQRELRRTIGSLEDRLAAGRADSTGAVPDPRPRGSSGDGGGVDVQPHPDVQPRPEDSRLAQMMSRLEEMERVIREDFGAAARAAVTGAAVPVGLGAPGGSAAASHGGGVVENIISDVERMGQPVHESFLRQLRRYKDVRPWPMPEGYQQRLAPSYLAQVYKNGVPAVQYAKKWIQDHQLSSCTAALEMVSLMEAVDDAVMSDGHDVINSVSFEKFGCQHRRRVRRCGVSRMYLGQSLRHRLRRILLLPL